MVGKGRRLTNPFPFVYQENTSCFVEIWNCNNLVKVHESYNQFL